jgi:hypothetical protein
MNGTLAEVCDRHFPGVTPCALCWVIRRRGYAHSRLPGGALVKVGAPSCHR